VLLVRKDNKEMSAQQVLPDHKVQQGLQEVVLLEPQVLLVLLVRLAMTVLQVLQDSVLPVRLVRPEQLVLLVLLV
jgi:hypothetical protein